MSKKISMSEKKFRKAHEAAWLDGHEHGVKTGYRDGEKYGRDAMSAEIAGTVIAPVLDAAIGLIENNLEDYANVLLVALRDKAREIGGEELDDMADIGDDEYECAGCCHECVHVSPDDQTVVTSDSLDRALEAVRAVMDASIEPVQDGHDPL